MKKLSRKYAVLLAVVSGVVTAFAFPTRFGSVMFPNLGFLAWFSLMPLFVAVYHASVRRAFLLSFLTGFIYYSISLYWVFNALNEYGNLSSATSLGVMFLMMVLLATFVALAPTWVTWFRRRWGGSPIYLLPVAWVTVVLARNFYPAGGFPWDNIAHTQAGYPIMIQTADMFSVYALTFFMIMVNQLLAALVLGWGHVKRRHLGVKALLVFVIFSLLMAYGWYRLETIQARSPSNRTIRTGLIQGNILQDEKWEEELLEENLKIYRKYMELLKNSDVTLIVWPESAYPFAVPLRAIGVKSAELGLNPEKKDGAWLLFGALSVNDDKVGEDLYNSAILVDNRGVIKERYHKKHLVPFGEYVPYRKVLFFANKLVEPLGDFVRGKAYAPIKVKDFKVGPLICFEDLFPEISRQMVVAGANILVNMTNDAWYGWTSAAYQHLAASVFRAVENRRYVLRATNTGITAVIDPTGKVELRSKLFTRGLMATGVSLFSNLTIYDKIGDLFAYLCTLFVILGTALVAGKSVIRRFNKNE
jgi:apolipoprotein N-acyltransferase